MHAPMKANLIATLYDYTILILLYFCEFVYTIEKHVESTLSDIIILHTIQYMCVTYYDHAAISRVSDDN